MRTLFIILGAMLLAGCQTVQVSAMAVGENQHPGEKHAYRLCTQNAKTEMGRRILAMARVMLARHDYYETPDASLLLHVSCAMSKPDPEETTTLESADPMDAAGPFLLGPCPGDDADWGYTWNEPSVERPEKEAIFIYTKRLGIQASLASNPKTTLWRTEAKIADQSDDLMAAVPFLLTAVGKELDENTHGWTKKYIFKHDSTVKAVRNTPAAAK